MRPSLRFSLGAAALGVIPVLVSAGALNSLLDNNADWAIDRCLQPTILAWVLFAIPLGAAWSMIVQAMALADPETADPTVGVVIGVLLGASTLLWAFGMFTAITSSCPG